MREHGIDPATGHLESCRYSGIHATGLIRRLRANAAALLDSREAHLLGLAKDFRDAAEEIERLARVSLSLPTSLGTDEIIETLQEAPRRKARVPQHGAALSELFPTCFPANRPGCTERDFSGVRAAQVFDSLRQGTIGSGSARTPR